MELLALAVAQWLHIAMGMLWVGASVALEVVVGPAMAALPPAGRQTLGGRLAARSVPFFAVVGSGTMLLGIVRGTVLGPLRHVEAFGSPYGITWLVALVLTAGLAALGALLIGPQAGRVYSTDDLWLPDARPALVPALRRLQILGRVQLGGFALVLTCMILMSLGL